MKKVEMGEGQPADFDSSGKVIIDGSQLKNFLQGLKSHMLYFWKCLDDQQILEHTMATLEKYSILLFNNR